MSHANEPGLTQQTLTLPLSGAREREICMQVLRSNVDLDGPDARRFTVDGEAVLVELNASSARSLRKMTLSVFESFDSILEVMAAFGTTQAAPAERASDEEESD